MAKVTSKLQLAAPGVIADQYGIRPGDDVEWVAAGEVICVIPPARGNVRREEHVAAAYASD
jgi:bifunctional DNA-binding transcriptional regulator/antitoxin component of YhaV-PrlF toxin-antitoxin module